jgi:hypothetical protein
MKAQNVLVTIGDTLQIRGNRLFRQVIQDLRVVYRIEDGDRFLAARMAG